jgi:hypothetical protein
VLEPRFSPRQPPRGGDGPDDLLTPTFTAPRRLADAGFAPPGDDPDDILDPSWSLASAPAR